MTVLIVLGVWLLILTFLIKFFQHIHNCDEQVRKLTRENMQVDSAPAYGTTSVGRNSDARIKSKLISRSTARILAGNTI